ncbi:SF3a splicing factor complex subunit [Dispira simplex]|nr:SF3a splicing factor complex subunit [Dispira simplex]
MTQQTTDTTPSALIKGIIYPPPDIRNIVDKTATFVAKSGERFEERLRDTNRNNPKFTFLFDNDPYHTYYVLKIRESREGTNDQQPLSDQRPTNVAIDLADLNRELATKKSDVARKEPPPPRPDDFLFICDIPALTAQDLDVIRCTAQFVALHGRPFLISLMRREQRNYQFAFLRPSHSLFYYFSKLVDQYTKVIQRPDKLTEKMALYAADKYGALDQVMKRVEYETFMQEEKAKQAEKEKHERLAFAAIYWHDFSVMGTIEFGPEDEQQELPLPTKLADLQGLSIAQKKMAEEAEALEQRELLEAQRSLQEAAPPAEEDMEMSDAEMEVASDSDEEAGVEKTQPSETIPPFPTVPVVPVKQIKIRKDYVPKVRTTTTATVGETTQLCPRCQQSIPISQMEEHMRIELLDPKWKEQKEAALAKHQGTNLVTTDTDVARLLKNLAGPAQSGTIEPGLSGVSVGDTTSTSLDAAATLAAKREPVVWDGHTASISLATQRAQANLTIEEQIAAIHRAQGIVPDPETSRIGPQLETKKNQTGRQTSGRDSTAQNSRKRHRNEVS